MLYCLAVEEANRVPVSVAHSPLFKLSEEVRDRIYRLVLIDQQDGPDGLIINPVAVHTDHGIHEPALLLCNKVIRSEALQIFYHENPLRCYVANYDPGPHVAFATKI